MRLGRGHGGWGAVEPGEVFGERYRLVSPLGRGGMGEVWSAADTMLGREVAIKIVLAELAPDPSLIWRLREEARTAAAVLRGGGQVLCVRGEGGGLDVGHAVPSHINTCRWGRRKTLISRRRVTIGGLTTAEASTIGTWAWSERKPDVLDGHLKTASTIAFSPDGKTTASDGGEQQHVRDDLRHIGSQP